MLGLEKELSLAKIAEKLDRSPSTISRELRRQKSAEYVATKAASRYQQQRKRCHKGKKLISGRLSTSLKLRQS